MDREHRAELLPLLHSLLYGKLQGARKGDRRKTAVFTFLAGSAPPELASFFSLLFADLFGLLPEEGCDLEGALMGLQLDLGQAIPLKRLLGMMSSLRMALRKIGPPLQPFLPTLLRLLLLANRLAGLLVARKPEIHARFHADIRALRSAAQEVLGDFLGTHDAFPFAKAELNAFLAIALLPRLEALPHEALQGPSAPLKLLLLLARLPRLSPLLAAKSPGGTSGLDALFALLDAASPGVQARILEALAGLVSAADFVPGDEAGPPLPQIEAIPAEFRTATPVGDLNVGTRLLLPYVGQLLAFFQQKLATPKGLKVPTSSPV